MKDTFSGLKIKRCFIIFFISSTFAATGCENVFDQTVDKNTDEAKFYQAKLEMNDRDYTSAITLLDSLTPTFLVQRPVALIYASAYSGRCGLDFVNFVDSLQNVGAATTLFVYLMSEHPGATDAKISDCVQAETLVKAIGTHTVRDANENILMGLSSLTKVGTVLARFADTDDDGEADATFDHCNLIDFPDDAVREIGTGVAQAILSITAVGADISSETLSEITSICSLNSNLNTFCTTTDKSAYSANEVSALRAILGSTDLGIGSCGGGFLPCICP